MGPDVAILLMLVLMITKDLPSSPRSPPHEFLSRCKFSTLTNRQPMVMIEFYLRSHAFRNGRKNTNSGDKNRTHDFRTSRCTGYLLDHSGKEILVTRIELTTYALAGVQVTY